IRKSAIIVAATMYMALFAGNPVLLA
ncbi:hypothetical protein LCGC14_2640500, partial [marine sediment metagenome]